MTLRSSLAQHKAMLIPVAIVVTILAVTIYAFARTGGTTTTQSSMARRGQYSSSLASPHASENITATEPTTQLSATTQEQLVYLIEEEKLAHDVYAKMYELYGARIFANITKSEANHQSRVLALLQSYGVADPRLPQAGQFQNKDLQALYDKLVAQGSTSISQAYAVGIAIEELDIRDLKTDLAALDANQTSIKTTLEALLSGSENHLRAFNRQVA